MPPLDDQRMTRNPFGEVSVCAVPFCVSVTVRPPTVSLIVRAVAWPFAVTLNRTVPLPLPLAPLVIDTQLTFGLSAEVQLHPLCDDTEIVTAPPDAPTAGVSGEIV
jgi:hypothetical protein